ncbi:MscL family protein [Mycoplasma phocoenae]|uniref:MscL family protein n=1 Tax=Mycoplasma phocoenae TaxID=754517 RepID=A0A858U6E6_9MOLU|nr:MscL family protein [Mycoplasma phocoenae]QJG66835.1 MscL family protein [Mycoplasma phocoenae]
MFKKSWNDAKAVVIRGNMLMLAIGLILGAAFGAVVKSLANDIIMGAILNIIGSDVTKGLEGMAQENILYGKFLGALLYFLIVSVFIFFALLFVFLLKNFKDRKKVVPVVEPKPTTEELILEELKKLNKKSKK